MKKLLVFIILTLTCFTSSGYASYCITCRSDVQEYMNQLVKKYHFEPEKIESLFSTVIMNEEVEKRLSKPAEAKPWYEYYNLLITPERINKGIEYWNTHEKTLARAEKQYGVPASIIVAIIGIETKYGANKGDFPVFNTLVTLGFNHGRRENFFRSELTEFLLLARENQLAPLSLKGSYAGALGLPQFMPSSYRNYAVDFSNKGYADLFNDNADAIGSVGNYLNKHGWKNGEPVTIAATVESDECSALVSKKYKPHLSESELEKYHVHPTQPLNSREVSFIRLEAKEGYENWLGLQNFYVISTYNNSELYVMAVNVLAQKLQELKIQNKEKPL